MASSKPVLEINAQRQICSVSFTGDGKQVLSGGDAGEVRRWQTDDGHEVGEPIRTGEQIYAVVSSPDCKWLVCALYAKNGGEHVRIWNAQTSEKVLDVKGHTAWVASADISHDSRRLATASEDKTVIIWDLATGQKLVGPLQHDDRVLTVRFSPNGDRIATAIGTNGILATKSARIYDSNNGQQLLVIPFKFHYYISSPLAWSTDGRQLFAVSYGEVKCFDPSSGSVVSKWTVPASSTTASIVLSRNQKFAVIVGDQSISVWDVLKGQQLGNNMQNAGSTWSVALSPNDDCIATGEANGKVTVRSLRGIIPDSYFPALVNLPFISINNALLSSWTQGNLNRVEELLTEEIADPSRSAHALAQRALVRSRLERWDMAIDDAKQSVELERTIVGYIAGAVACAGKGEHESALDIFDLVFSIGLPTENILLLMIRAILMLKCGRHDHAVSRADGIIDIVDNKSLYAPVRAQMSLLLGGILLGEGNVEQAVELLQKARDSMPVQSGPHLTIITLIFGWEFDKLDAAIEKELQKCVQPIADLGDVAVQCEKPDEAVRHYSAALSLGPPNPVDLRVKRSKVYGMLKEWEKALMDADEAITADPASVWGYETKYAALCGLGRHDEASGVFAHMFTLVEGSADQAVRDLAKKYVAPSLLVKKIDDVIQDVSKTSPLVLIDVKSGYLCDGPKRTFIFKSEGEFGQLRSSMMEKVNEEQIHQVVAKYFEYVTFSHVWEGQEPLLQDVEKAGTVWDLDSSSPLHVKLQKFCNVVQADGFRWAWSDTVCIDKTISTVLNQSLRMMYLWYESSAATFVYLTDVELLVEVLGLKESRWLTRAWTSQELLVPKTIRFYTRDWEPYRGDTRRNHKESPEIMQELVDAIGITRDTIVSFSPDQLSVRQKLRLASTRNATREEDIAYSLIGIFKSDIRPDYGEGYAAVGHLLEEIVARSGDVTVLDWTGKPSPFNSCLPSSLKVYSRPPGLSPTISDEEMATRITELRDSVSRPDAIQLHDQITSLPPARFANRRLHLPCIIFGVRRLGVQNFGHGHEFRYRARATGLGDIDFHTSDKLPPTEARKLVFVHPWIRNLRDPHDGFSWGDTTDDDGDDDGFEFGPDDDESAPPSPLHVPPTAPMDEYTQALRLVARLQQPFHALLLQQQSNGEFRRVATEHEIIVPGMRSGVNFAKDIRTGAVEIL